MDRNRDQGRKPHRVLQETSVDLDNAGRMAPARVLAKPAVVSRRSLVAAYRTYYESGLYDRRYPRPNPRTLRVILAEIARRGPRVLDFGCGSGRYAAAILAASDASVVGYDPCPAAMAQLRARHDISPNHDRLTLVSGALGSLALLTGGRGGFDLVIVAFGVLAHIPGTASRRATLRGLTEILRPGGAIVLGLPNVARRFRREQQASPGPEPGDVLYERRSANGPVPLFYHLYRQEEMRAELAAAGLHAISLRAESILPERWVVSSRAGALADQLLAACIPRRAAYGFLVVAEPAGGAR